jgi:hypothetical protein
VSEDAALVEVRTLASAEAFAEAFAAAFAEAFAEALVATASERAAGAGIDGLAVA